ncbi:TLDc domain [Trinorchestia longiramus]|nr:TLDc domain [Trinorchestia longiramus]
MGADGSKNSSTANSPPRTPWLLETEIKAINEHLKSMTNDGKVSDAALLASSKGNGEKLSELFITLLKKWPHQSTGKEQPSASQFLVAQLTSVIMQVLNPDPSVQAEVLAIMAGTAGGAITSTDLVKVVAAMIERYSSLQGVAPDASGMCVDAGSSARVAREWLHMLLFGDASHKKTTTMEVPSSAVSQAALERWLQGHAAVYAVVQVTVLRALALPSLSPPASLFPQIIAPKEMQMQLSSSEVLLLNTSLPLQLRCQWRLLFSNHMHGDSFSLLMKQIVGAGPSLVVVEDEDGNKFGGFASASWEVRPQFHGTAESFLFSLQPYAGVYRSTGYNSNYQYLNYLHNNTMPNGLGMGGREELFGLFLSYDFGECTVAPSCTTFASPALCPNLTPRVSRLVVWGVGEEPKDSDDDSDEEIRSKKPSALDRNPEARAMLDMIGRTRASEGLREPEQQ